MNHFFFCQEITLTGPVLRFNTDTVISICGADFECSVKKSHGASMPVALWQAVHIQRGDVLRIGSVSSAAECKVGGVRAVLAVKGGWDVPIYLGSRSTFQFGKFGGHSGRLLRHGDVLHFGERASARSSVEEKQSAEFEFRSFPRAIIPVISTKWNVCVLYGPHGAPDFFVPVSQLNINVSFFFTIFNALSFYQFNVRNRLRCFSIRITKCTTTAIDWAYD